MRTEDMMEKQDREAGFTLLEVIVAISILSVGLLAVASMQTAAIKGNDGAYRITEGDLGTGPARIPPGPSV